MTSDRPYRSALALPAAREEIERGSGRHYDSQVASAFLGIPAETWLEIRKKTAKAPVSPADTAKFLAGCHDYR